jgi:hypothetical protein
MYRGMFIKPLPGKALICHNTQFQNLVSIGFPNLDVRVTAILILIIAGYLDF